MRNDFFGEMAETGGVPLNASPVRRWAGVFGHRPFAFSISMGIKNVLDDLLSSNYSDPPSCVFLCAHMDMSMDTHMDTSIDIHMDMSMDIHMEMPIKSKVSKLDGSCT